MLLENTLFSVQNNFWLSNMFPVYFVMENKKPFSKIVPKQTLNLAKKRMLINISPIFVLGF